MPRLVLNSASRLRPLVAFAIDSMGSCGTLRAQRRRESAEPPAGIAEQPGRLAGRARDAGQYFVIFRADARTKSAIGCVHQEEEVRHPSGAGVTAERNLLAGGDRRDRPHPALQGRCSRPTATRSATWSTPCRSRRARRRKSSSSTRRTRWPARSRNGSSQGERLALGLVNERDITHAARRQDHRIDARQQHRQHQRHQRRLRHRRVRAPAAARAMADPAAPCSAWPAASPTPTRAPARTARATSSQFFGEKLRQSIMQNAEGYRQLNASVVTTVQEGQRYGVTSEVVANHNHCHALTMMYFEVLRHYAIFQELVLGRGVRVRAAAADAILRRRTSTSGATCWRRRCCRCRRRPTCSRSVRRPGRPRASAGQGLRRQRAHQHQLRQRRLAGRARTTRSRSSSSAAACSCASTCRGPRTRYDRIKSLPVTTQTITTRNRSRGTGAAALEFPRTDGRVRRQGRVTAGFYALFTDRRPPPASIPGATAGDPGPRGDLRRVHEPGRQLSRASPRRSASGSRISSRRRRSRSAFGHHTHVARRRSISSRTTARTRSNGRPYATLLGYTDVLDDARVPTSAGNLISEWDTIFYNDIVPLVFEKIVDSIRLSASSRPTSPARRSTPAASGTCASTSPAPRPSSATSCRSSCAERAREPALKALQELRHASTSRT